MPAPCSATIAARLVDGMYQPDRLTPSAARNVTSSYRSPRSAGVAAPTAGTGGFVTYTAAAAGSITNWTSTNATGTASRRHHPRTARIAMVAPTVSRTRPVPSVTTPATARADTPVLTRCGTPIAAPAITPTIPASSTLQPRRTAAPRTSASTTAAVRPVAAASRTAVQSGEPPPATRTRKAAPCPRVSTTSATRARPDRRARTGCAGRTVASMAIGHLLGQSPSDRGCGQRRRAHSGERPGRAGPKPRRPRSSSAAGEEGAPRGCFHG